MDVLADAELSAAALAVASRGFACLRGFGADEGALRTLIQTVGSPRGGAFWGEIQVVRYLPAMSASGSSVANSAAELLAHTDGSFESEPPEFLFLQCVKRDLPGHGDSYVIDGHAVLASLAESTVRALESCEFTFSRESEGRAVSYTVPIVRMRAGTPTIRYRVDPAYRILTETAAGAAALRTLTEALHGHRYREYVPLEPGDVLWLDNTRVLHGRERLSGRAERVLRTGWADRRTGDLTSSAATSREQDM